MRDILVAAVGLIGVLAMEAVGQVFQFGLPEANLPERVVGISDNGVVGATLVRFEPYGWGGFVYREGSWSELHPESGPSRLLGFSADGSVTLSHATWPDGGLFLRGGFGSVSLPTDHAAALSSDGRTVLLGSGGGGAGGPLEISRWRNGTISPMLTLPDRYIANPRLLAGGTGDVFVVSADNRGVRRVQQSAAGGAGGRGWAAGVGHARVSDICPIDGVCDKRGRIGHSWSGVRLGRAR